MHREGTEASSSGRHDIFAFAHSPCIFTGHRPYSVPCLRPACGMASHLQSWGGGSNLNVTPINGNLESQEGFPGRLVLEHLQRGDGSCAGPWRSIPERAAL